MKWVELTPEQRDALVVEKVFGWQWIPAGRYGPHVKEGTSWLLPKNGLSGIKSELAADWISIGEERFAPRNWIPHYTTSMDAAWRMLTHLKEQDLFVNFAIHCDKKDRRDDFDRIGINICFRNTVNVDRYPYNHSTVRVESLDEMPGAICKAALIACGAIEDKSEL